MTMPCVELGPTQIEQLNVASAANVAVNNDNVALAVAMTSISRGIPVLTAAIGTPSDNNAKKHTKNAMVTGTNMKTAPRHDTLLITPLSTNAPPLPLLVAVLSCSVPNHITIPTHSELVNAVRAAAPFLRKGSSFRAPLCGSPSVNDCAKDDQLLFTVEHCEPFVQGAISTDRDNNKVQTEIHVIVSDRKMLPPIEDESDSRQGQESLMSLLGRRDKQRRSFSLEMLPIWAQHRVVAPRFLVDSASTMDNSFVVQSDTSVPDYYLEALSTDSSESRQMYCTNADSTIWCNPSVLRELAITSGDIVRAVARCKCNKEIMSDRVVSLVGTTLCENSNDKPHVFASPTLLLNFQKSLPIRQYLDDGTTCTHSSLTVEILSLSTPSPVLKLPVNWISTIPIQESLAKIANLTLSRVADPNVSSNIYDEALNVLRRTFASQKSRHRCKSIFIREGDLIAVIVDRGRVISSSVVPDTLLKTSKAVNDGALSAAKLGEISQATQLCVPTQDRQVVFFHVDCCKSMPILSKEDTETNSYRIHLAKAVIQLRKLQSGITKHTDLSEGDSDPFNACYDYGFFDISTTRLVVDGVHCTATLPTFYRNWYLHGVLGNNCDSTNLGKIPPELSLFTIDEEKRNIYNTLEVFRRKISRTLVNDKGEVSIGAVLVEAPLNACIWDTLTVFVEHLGIPIFRISLLDIWNAVSTSNDAERNSNLNSDLLTFKVNELVIKYGFQGIVVFDGLEIFSDKSNEDQSESLDGPSHIREFLLQFIESVKLILGMDSEKSDDNDELSTFLRSKVRKPTDVKGNANGKIGVICLAETVENFPQNLNTFLPQKIKIPEFLSLEERVSFFTMADKYENVFNGNEIDYKLMSLMNHAFDFDEVKDRVVPELQSSFMPVSISPDVSIDELASHTAGFSMRNLYGVKRLSLLNATKRIDKWVDETFNGRKWSRKMQQLQGKVIIRKDVMDAIEMIRKGASDSVGAPTIPKVYWEDIGGMQHIKDSIIDTIELPMKHPELFEGSGKKRSGILLYGPPGTGKTLVAKAVATEFGMNFLSVKGPELLNMYIGESEANVRKIFARAKQCKPCVIFFDELDSVAPRRGAKGDSGGVMDRIVSQLLAEMDEINVSPRKKQNTLPGSEETTSGSNKNTSSTNDIFIIGATNRPDLLDQALLRPGRFDSLLYLGISDSKEKQISIIEALSRKFNLDKDIDFSKLDIPRNLTGADLYALCSDALLNACNRVVQSVEDKLVEVNTQRKSVGKPILSVDEVIAKYFIADGNMNDLVITGNIAKSEKELVVVNMEDFKHSVNALKPSVSPEELARYEKIRDDIEREKMERSKKFSESINGQHNDDDDDDSQLKTTVTSKRKNKGKGAAVR